MLKINPCIILLIHLIILSALIRPTISQSDTPDSDVFINEENDKIFIKADSVPLIRVLEAIERYNGTHFLGQEAVEGNTISVKLSAKGWNELFRKLLSDYSWVSIINQDKSDSMTIHILPESSHSDLSTSPLPDNIDTNTRKEKSASGLSQSQLTRLSHGALRSPLPFELLSEPEIKLFVKNFGINTYDDMNDIDKAMKARNKARQELRSLLK